MTVIGHSTANKFSVRSLRHFIIENQSISFSVKFI